MGSSEGWLEHGPILQHFLHELQLLRLKLMHTHAWLPETLPLHQTMAPAIRIEDISHFQPKSSNTLVDIFYKYPT